MFDPATIAALASSAVALITPLLQKAVDKGAEEVGKSAVSSLLGKLKERLTHGGAKEALEDLAQTPADSAAQGALSMQLRKALAADPDLAAFLKKWVEESKTVPGIIQTANFQGDSNKVTQITGSGNQVSS